MAKYRKKPVVVEAVQFWPEERPWPEGVCVNPGCPQERSPHIHTLEGDHLVSPGDFVITGVKGERYPCKADIFAATYELA